MSEQTRRQVLVTLGGTVLVGLAGCSQGGDGEETTGAGGTATDESTATETEMDTDTEMEETETETEGMSGTANVRVAHMSPDAPNVDVFVDGNAVLEDVPFREVSDYLEVESGDHDVAVAPAGSGMDSAVIDQTVMVEANTDYTIAAIGEVAEDGEDLRPLVLEDPTGDPGGNMARLRLVHASPDAPAVDVTAAGGDVVLFDGAAFGDSAATTVEGNDYTVEVRGDTDANDGDVVADFDVSLNGGTVYTAFAAGYLSPDDEPSDEAFDLVVAQDASY